MGWRGTVTYFSLSIVPRARAPRSLITHSLTHSVEERTCLVCKENCIEHEQHYLMYCRGYTTLRRELHSHISNADIHYPSLSDNEKTRYLLRAENTITSKIVGKYIHLIFQKRKEILGSQM